MLKRNRQRGFTLIELLIVVAIIGIIAAILIPNLLDALQKAKQKRTLSDIRNTGTALMAWLTDQVGAASAGQATAKVYAASQFGMSTFSYAAVYGYLRPTDTFFYMQEIPELDGWRSPLVFAMAGTPTNVAILQAGVMMIGAPCRDETFVEWANPAADVTTFAFLTTDYNQDIVWADGYMVRWPEGSKK